jgi:hypothetical protein
VRGLALLAALALAVSAHAGVDLPTRASSQSGVTVKVTPRSLAGTAWEFEVAFDTHTQPLTDDLAKTAELVVVSGSAAAPLDWQGDPPGGHHRKGVLRFKAPSPRPASFELRISRPGETQVRAFRWQLK